MRRRGFFRAVLGAGALAYSGVSLATVSHFERARRLGVVKTRSEFAGLSSAASRLAAACDRSADEGIADLIDALRKPSRPVYLSDVVISMEIEGLWV